MADVTNGYAPDAARVRGDADVEAAAAQTGRAGLAVQLAGAALSVSLLVGGVVWGYRLIVRDVTGVPVVSAMAGPMREAPSDPGGEVALHTGLSVNAVAAIGEAGPPEDVLVLAPPTPDLTDEDLTVMPMAEADEYHPEADPAVSPPGAEAAGHEGPAPALPGEGTMSAADVLALADAIAAGATPMTALSDEPLAAQADAMPPQMDAAAVGAVPDAAVGAGVDAAANADFGVAVAAADAAADDVAALNVASNVDFNADSTADAVAAAVAAAVLTAIDQQAANDVSPGELTPARVDTDGLLLRAVRPTARPEVRAAATGAVTPPADSATAAAGFAISTAQVPAGTTLVQLGAFDTPDMAGAEWGRLLARFEAFMDGKGSLIQEATSGGRAFYRLRATGFADIADARRFCSALVAEDAACIPVVVQ